MNNKSSLRFQKRLMSVPHAKYSQHQPPQSNSSGTASGLKVRVQDLSRKLSQSKPRQNSVNFDKLLNL